MKKDIVVSPSVNHIEAVADGFLRLTLAKVSGEEFEVVVPAEATVGAAAPQILKAGGYEGLLDLKLLMPDGRILEETDKLIVA